MSKSKKTECHECASRNATGETSGREITHGQEPPHDGGRGQAGEDVVGAGEVGEVGQQDALAPALAPHVHLAALGLCGRRVRGVTGGDLHDPAEWGRGWGGWGSVSLGRTPGAAWWCRRLPPLFARHDLHRAQLVALVADTQLSVGVGPPGVDQAFVGQSQRVSVARHNLRETRR